MSTDLKMICLRNLLELAKTTVQHDDTMSDEETVEDILKHMSKMCGAITFEALARGLVFQAFPEQIGQVMTDPGVGKDKDWMVTLKAAGDIFCVSSEGYE